MIVGAARVHRARSRCAEAVDRHADIGAFGCVLYEMLTARSFARRNPYGHDRANCRDRARVADAARLDAAGRPTLKHAVSQKDPKRRLRDVGDLDLALDMPVEAPRESCSWRVPLAAVLAGVVVAGLAAVTWPSREAVTPPAAVRFEIPASIRTGESESFAISPDGRHLVFDGTGANGISGSGRVGSTSSKRGR